MKADKLKEHSNILSHSLYCINLLRKARSHMEDSVMDYMDNIDLFDKINT